MVSKSFKIVRSERLLLVLATLTILAKNTALTSLFEDKLDCGVFRTHSMEAFCFCFFSSVFLFTFEYMGTINLDCVLGSCG